MAMTETRYAHVVLDERGIPHIAGTTMKVVELVNSHQAYGWGPDELVSQYPHLTLGQVYAALGYYWDHKEEMDRYIAEELAFVDELRRTTPEAPIVAKIRALREIERRRCP